MHGQFFSGCCPCLRRTSSSIPRNLEVRSNSLTKSEITAIFAPERFSLLLLSQIPPPRGGSGPRWEAGAPLDIVFHAVDQNDGERRDMAIRLLALVRLWIISDSFSAQIEVFRSSLTLPSRDLLMVRCLQQHSRLAYTLLPPKSPRT